MVDLATFARKPSILCLQGREGRGGEGGRGGGGEGGEVGGRYSIYTHIIYIYQNMCSIRTCTCTVHTYVVTEQAQTGSCRLIPMTSSDITIIIACKNNQFGSSSISHLNYRENSGCEDKVRSLSDELAIVQANMC